MDEEEARILAREMTRAGVKKRPASSCGAASSKSCLAHGSSTAKKQKSGQKPKAQHAKHKHLNDVCHKKKKKPEKAETCKKKKQAEQAERFRNDQGALFPSLTSTPHRMSMNFVHGPTLPCTPTPALDVLQKKELLVGMDFAGLGCPVVALKMLGIPCRVSFVSDVSKSCRAVLQHHFDIKCDNVFADALGLIKC